MAPRRGNPGPSAVGVVIFDAAGREVHRESRRVGARHQQRGGVPGRHRRAGSRAWASAPPTSSCAWTPSSSSASSPAATASATRDSCPSTSASSTCAAASSPSPSATSRAPATASPTARQPGARPLLLALRAHRRVPSDEPVSLRQSDRLSAGVAAASAGSRSLIPRPLQDRCRRSAECSDPAHLEHSLTPSPDSMLYSIRQ